MYFSGSLESEESCKVLSQKCFTDTQISENPQVTVCKSGSSLEDFGNIPTDKNYCEIQPDQSIGEKTWAECDKDCPTEINHGMWSELGTHIFHVRFRGYSSLLLRHLCLSLCLHL